MTQKRDELGLFLEAYELYFKGELEYSDLPSMGDILKIEPPREATCTDCYKKFMRKWRLVRYSEYGVIWAFQMLCPECREIDESGPRQPLPVAKVIKR